MAVSAASSALVSAGFGAQGRNATASVTQGMVYNDLSALTDLKTQSREDPTAALKEVSKQFESLFVNMMMKAMRDTLPKDGLMGGPDVQTYQEMFDQQLALDLSNKGALGLASVIERQLSNVIAPADTAPVATEMPLDMAKFVNQSTGN